MIVYEEVLILNRNNLDHTRVIKCLFFFKFCAQNTETNIKPSIRNCNYIITVLTIKALSIYWRTYLKKKKEKKINYYWSYLQLIISI